MALALAGSASIAGAQQTAPPLPRTGVSTSTFLIFVRSAQIGVEQIAVTRTAEGWDILSTGRIAPPVDIVARRLEIRYTADWHPVEFAIDASVRNQPQAIHTTFDATSAKNDITVGGQTTSKSDPIEQGAIVLPSGLFSPYEALAARLRTAAPNATFPVYILPQVSMTLTVVDSATDQIQTSSRLIAARRTHVTISTPNVPLDLTIWGDENGRLLRLTVPAQNLDVVREDIASVASRRVSSRGHDERVRSANGFTLAGTLVQTHRACRIAAARGCWPAARTSRSRRPRLQHRDARELATRWPTRGSSPLRQTGRGPGGGRLKQRPLPTFRRSAGRYQVPVRPEGCHDKRIAVAGHNERPRLADIGWQGQTGGSGGPLATGVADPISCSPSSNTCEPVSLPEADRQTIDQLASRGGMTADRRFADAGRSITPNSRAS